jgi:hypothetical protein
MAQGLHRIQYISNLPRTLLRKNAHTYLQPVAPTLVVLGHMLYPNFFEWCAEHWKSVVYAPFDVQGVGTEAILRSAAILQPPLRLAYFLPRENVVFLAVSETQRNLESYQYWTYRGASIVLVSREPLSEGLLCQYKPSPAAHVFANSRVAMNRASPNTLSVSNPVFCGQGQRVANWDKAAFFDVKSKNEQGCEVNPDVAYAGAALYPAEIASMNPYDPLK